MVTEPGEIGSADLVSWLATDLLLVVGWFHAEKGVPLQAVLDADGDNVPLDMRCMSYPRTDVPAVKGDAGKILTLRLPEGFVADDGIGQLTIRTNGRTVVLHPPDLAEAVIDLDRLLAESRLVTLPPWIRTAVTEFLVTTPVAHAKVTANPRLSAAFATIRKALRVRLPRAVNAPDHPLGVAVDRIIAVDERSFYLNGWFRDAAATVTRLTAVSPEGSRAELLERLFRYPRPDVEQGYGTHHDPLHAVTSGVVAYFTIDAPSYLTTDWSIELRDETGQGVEVAAPPLIKNPSTAITSILADLFLEPPPRDRLLRDHVFPAVSTLQERLHEATAVERVAQYGIPPESPDVSIVVPLYGRIDCLVHQLAQFVHDPTIGHSDLIYVLGSPELAEDLALMAAQLCRLYPVPFRVVTLTRNAGFAAATNAGVALARGRLLLLLNSDVLPDKPGWLEMMTTFYRSTPKIGALAPKLLYEDDSLQHAGMYFAKPAGSALWMNEHYFKGLHRRLPAANVARSVPAVTGACLMIDRRLYEELGRLRGDYMGGDYEDSDLCLRLFAAGYANWYLPSAELYHLEGPSFPGALRSPTHRYNQWLHTRRWAKELPWVIAAYGPE